MKMGLIEMILLIKDKLNKIIQTQKKIMENINREMHI